MGKIRKRKKKCPNCEKDFLPVSKANKFCSSKCRTEFNSANRVACKCCWKYFNPLEPKKGKDYRKKFCNLSCYGKWLAGASPEEKKKGLSLDLEEVLEDLKPFLKVWLNLNRACIQANLPYKTIYNYTISKDLLEKYPEIQFFRNELEKYLNFWILVSRNVVVSEISNNKNWKLALEFLGTQDNDFIKEAEEQEIDEYEFWFSPSAFVGGKPEEKTESSDLPEVKEEPKSFKIKIKKTKWLKK